MVINEMGHLKESQLIEEIQDRFKLKDEVIEKLRDQLMDKVDLLSYIEEHCDDAYEWALENYKK